MAENLEAYFKSENDAEAASAKLKTLNTNSVMVEKVPDDMDTNFFVPFQGSSYITTIGVGGLTSASPAEMGNEDSDEQSGRLTHLLHFQVEEKDYDKAIEILKESGSYVDKSLLS